MTAPAPTARGTPTGIPLENSFPIRVTIGANTTVSFWEKEIQPPGYEGGEAIDTTTQFNNQFRGMAPRHLITMTAMKGKAAYDPNVCTQIILLINKKTTITKTWSDGSTLAFYGFLKSFTPSNEAGDGTQPEADFEIQPTNIDPTSGVEEPPVFTNVSGT